MEWQGRELLVVQVTRVIPLSKRIRKEIFSRFALEHYVHECLLCLGSILMRGRVFTVPVLTLWLGEYVDGNCIHVSTSYLVRDERPSSCDTCLHDVKISNNFSIHEALSKIICCDHVPQFVLVRSLLHSKFLFSVSVRGVVFCECLYSSRIVMSDLSCTSNTLEWVIWVSEA